MGSTCSRSTSTNNAMNDETKKALDEMEKRLGSRLSSVEEQVKLPTHYHNGFDSNQVNFADLYQRKIWVHHTIIGTAAATAANYAVFLIVPIACLVTKIQEVHQTLGTDAGAVTLNIEKLTSGVALDSGAAILSTAFDLKASVNVVRTGTLTTTASSRTLARGDRLAMKDAGTLTAVANVTISVELQF